jgi:hypothetical protein
MTATADILGSTLHEGEKLALNSATLDNLTVKYLLMPSLADYRRKIQL